MALTTCRILDAALVIARLDRLSRNVAKRKPNSQFGHQREATPAHARLINGPAMVPRQEKHQILSEDVKRGLARANCAIAAPAQEIFEVGLVTRLASAPPSETPQ